MKGVETSHILDSLSAPVAVIDQQGNIVSVNDAWSQFYCENNGPEPNDFVGINYLASCRGAIDEGDPYAKQAHDGIQSVLNGEISKFELTYPCHSPNEERWYNMRVTPIRMATCKFVVAHENVTEHKKFEQQINRTNRIFDVLAKVNKEVSRASDPYSFLQSACRVIHNDGGFIFAWIGEAREVDGDKVVVPVACDGEGADYLKEITVKWDNSKYAAGAGRAIKEKRPVIVKNVEEDEFFQLWREQASKQEFASAIAIPLILSEENAVFGSLNLYSKNVESFKEQELKVLEQVATDIASGYDIIRQRVDKQQAQQELAESHETLKYITDAVPGVVYRYKITPDGNQQFDFVSAGVEDLFDSSREEFNMMLQGQWDKILPDDYEYLKQTIVEAVQNVEPWEAEFRIKIKGGDITWIHGASVPEPPKDDGSIVFNGIFSDVTARRMAEDTVNKLNLELEQRVRERTEELERANQELETFNHTVSHDLKNPIRSVEIFAKFLEKRYGDRLDQQGIEYIQSIHNSVNEMKELIQDLLQLSRVGQNELEKEEVDMNALCQSIFQDLRQHDHSSDIEFHAYDMPEAKADHNVIKYAVRNLLSNALKFTQDRNPAVIEVGGYRKDDESIFYVRDNGAGFDPAQYRDLFKTFKRLHSNEEFEGTGIGLAIVEKALVRHGGYVCADSKEGEGAIFYFALPAA